MNKKITLVVPCYNTHKTLPRLFGSVLSQTICSDIHILLVDDASEETYEELVKQYNMLDIEIVRYEENGGPGHARQVGINNCKTEYIIFMDSDDTFFSPFSAEHLYKEIYKNNLDIVYSDFVEECEGDIFVPHKQDGVWMFGKIFRTEFLKNKDLNFNDTRSNEDNGFNTLCRFFTNPGYLDEITYVWHFNSNSITRKKNGLYTYTCMEGQIWNKIWAYKEAYKKGIDRKEYLKNIAGQFSFYYFDFYNRKRVNREEVDPNCYFEWIARYYNEFKNEIKECKEKDILEEEYKQNFIQYYNDFNNIVINDETIYQFIEKLDNYELEPKEPLEWGQK